MIPQLKKNKDKSQYKWKRSQVMKAFESIISGEKSEESRSWKESFGSCLWVDFVSVWFEKGFELLCSCLRGRSSMKSRVWGDKFQFSLKNEAFYDIQAYNQICVTVILLEKVFRDG